MKSAKEWREQFDYETELSRGPDRELAGAKRTEEERYRAIQADALEAAALRCAGIAYLHHDEHDECEWRDAANECVAEIRKLKPEQA